MRFCEIDCFFFQSFFASAKKDWERNSLKGPALRSRSLKNSPGDGAFLHKKAKMLPPNQINRTPPPIERSRSIGGGFLDFACSADLLHGH